MADESWDDILPRDPDERARARTILTYMKENPTSVEMMFDNGWDSRRGNAGARKIVRECVPLLKQMQAKHAQSHGDAAATTDIDQTIRRFYSERQQAVALRRTLKSSEHQVKQLKRELKKMLAIRAQTQEMIEQTTAGIRAHEQEVLRCDSQSSQMERKLQELKATMTNLVVTLMREIAGIQVGGAGDLPLADESGGEEEEVRVDLNPRGAVADAEMCRVSTQRIKEHNNKADLYRRLVEKKARGGVLSDIERRVVGRGAPRMRDDDLRAWGDLHRAVQQYQGTLVPRAMLEPDGDPDAPPGTSWWGRFSAYYLSVLKGTPAFDYRDHPMARRLLRELNERMLVGMEEADEAEPPPSRDAEEEDALEGRVQEAEQRLLEKIQGMLDAGAFDDERTAALAQAAVSKGRVPSGLCGALTQQRRLSTPLGEILNDWNSELRKKQEEGAIGVGDAAVLQEVWNRYERSVWAPQSTGEGRGGGEFMEHFTWIKNKATMMVKTILSQGNRAFVAAHPDRIGMDPPDVANSDVEQRMARYQTFMNLLVDISKRRSAGGAEHRGAASKVMEPSKGNFIPMSNYVHRDHWLRDWRFCTLAQALEPGSRERFNLIDPPDYTIGGWACLRCTKTLDARGGDCECLCFRGHTRTQCMAEGSGCYGFHPNRAMEFLALGTPRMPLRDRETQQRSLGAKTRRAASGSRRVRSKNKEGMSDPDAFHKRKWVFRQRWYTFRKEMKSIVCGYQAWLGVVPVEERVPEYEGLVADVGAVVRDWLLNFDWDNYGPPVQGEGTEKKRCEWVVKTHLDILLDPTKHDPERKRKYPTHNRGPNWRWISEGCPICTFLYEANNCNVGRGLCNGCRTWGVILSLANHLMDTDPKYAVLRPRSPLHFQPPTAPGMVDVSGVDRDSLLEALWRNAKQGAFFAAHPGLPVPTFDLDAAKQEIRGNYADYVRGRCIKARVYTADTAIDPAGYDGENGAGAFQRVVDSLRSSVPAKRPRKRKRPSRPAKRANSRPKRARRRPPTLLELFAQAAQPAVPPPRPRARRTAATVLFDAWGFTSARIV